jgi:hypothetical protein
LIEKKITKPAKFKAVPMDLGIDSLLKRKSLEHDNLKAKTKLLLREYKEKTLPQPFELEAAHFALIPQRETVVNRIRQAIDNAEKSVDIFLSWKRFSLGITSTFAESAQKAWTKGVKFRLVVESPKESADVELAWHFCQKSPFCNVRFLPRPPRTVLGIYDQKHFFVIVHPRKGLFDSPALWSNNKSLLSVVEDYFEILWVTAMEEPKPPKSA